MAKTQVLFTCSEEFKEALGTYAQVNRLSAAEVIREAVARFIKYDISTEVVDDKRKKYANAEERKEAQRKRQKTERENVRLLLQYYAKEQREIDAAILENSLKRKGVDVER
jgi:protein associated with RNAse G/E